jgi:hypothetical protein
MSICLTAGEEEEEDRFQGKHKQDQFVRTSAFTEANLTVQVIFIYTI